MKKIFATVLALAIFIPNIAFAADYRTYNIKGQLPDGWTVSKNDGSDVTVGNHKDVDCIIISSETPTKASTNAKLYTDEFVFADMQIIRLHMAIDSAKDWIKRLYIGYGTVKKEIFAIKDGVLNVGDTALPKNEFFDLDIAIDVSGNSAVFWLNSEYIGTATIDFASYKDQSVCLQFWNVISNKQTSSFWYISKVDRIERAEYSIKSNPDNNSSFVDVATLDKISMDFDTVIPKLLTKDMKLEIADIDSDTYSEISFEKTGNDHHLEIVPTEGFKKLKSYRFTLSTGDDLFKVNHTDDYVLVFTTAPAGYSAPSCNISSEDDGKTVVAGKTVSVSANVSAGSASLTKAEIYQNNTCVDTITGDYSFTLKAVKGTNAVYVKLYDEDGGISTSNTVTFIGKDNEAPEITSDIPEDGAVNQGSKLQFTAADADGAVKQMFLRVDGKKIIEASDNVIEWTVSQKTEFGKHDLEIVAVDDLGLMAVKKYLINIEQYNFNEKIRADYSDFNKTLTDKNEEISKDIYAYSKPKSTSTNYYIKNGTIDEEHGNCVIMGADVKTSGDSAWLGVSNFSEMNRPSGIVIIETDVYLSCLHIMADIKASDVNGNDSAMVTFWKNQIQYQNNTVVTRDVAESGKWYNIRIELNITDSTYNLYINGEKLAENYNTPKKLTGNLKYVRMLFYNYENEPGFAATSKLVISENAPYLAINGLRCEKEQITIDEGGNEVSAQVATTDINSANMFIFKLNSIIDKKVKVQDFQLFAENDKVIFDSYEISDSEIFVKLKYPVIPNCNYRAVISYLIDGKEYKAAYCFESGIEKVGIRDCDFHIEDENITVSTTIESSEATTATIMIAKFKGNVLKEIKAQDISLSVGENNITTPPVSYDSDGDFIYRTYLWKGLSDGNRKSLSIKVPELSNKLTEF